MNIGRSCLSKRRRTKGGDGKGGDDGGLDLVLIVFTLLSTMAVDRAVAWLVDPRLAWDAMASL